mgnify:CR=1 FL=1
MKQLRKILNWIKTFYYWVKSFFIYRYTVHVSFDSQWGNEDDQIFTGVRKIIKSNFKELKFRTEDNRTVHIRGMNGLRYRIEDE